MRGLFSLFMLFSVILAITYGDLIPVPKLRPDDPESPNLPPFNPRPILGTGPFYPGPIGPDVLLVSITFKKIYNYIIAVGSRSQQYFENTERPKLTASYIFPAIYYV